MVKNVKNGCVLDIITDQFTIGFFSSIKVAVWNACT